MMRAVAIIPARYASQRLPGKPLVDIGGRPMIQRVYERARRAASLNSVVVATDDERIANAVADFGGTAIMTSPELPSGTDRVAAAARRVHDAEIIVNVQGDEPLLVPEMVDEAVAVVAGSDAVAGTLVKKIDNDTELFNSNIVKVVLSGKGECLYFSRSPIPFGRDLAQQEWRRAHPYYKHIGLYVFRRAFLLQYAALPPTPLERAEKLEQLRILEHGYRISAAVTTHDSIPVDTPDDLEKVRLIYRTHHEHA
jgi:3-deoxy-manno-octulosonate cytidylyltransferase (CMP-KDO synthetase)